MFSTDFIFRQQGNIVENQKCQAGFRPLRNKKLSSDGFTNLVFNYQKTNNNYTNRDS